MSSFIQGAARFSSRNYLCPENEVLQLCFHPSGGILCLFPLGLQTVATLLSCYELSPSSCSSHKPYYIHYSRFFRPQNEGSVELDPLSLTLALSVV